MDEDRFWHAKMPAEPRQKSSIQLTLCWLREMDCQPTFSEFLSPRSLEGERLCSAILLQYFTRLRASFARCCRRGMSGSRPIPDAKRMRRASRAIDAFGPVAAVARNRRQRSAYLLPNLL